MSMIATAARSRQADPARPAGLHRHRLRPAAGAGARARGARPRAARHGDRPPADVRAMRPTPTRSWRSTSASTASSSPTTSASIIQEGLGDYTPIFLSDIPRLFTSGQLPLDVALIQVTPAGRARHVQPRRLGGHRQERRGERQPRHRPGQPAHAAHAGRQLPPRLRHRRPRARRRAAHRGAAARAERRKRARSASTSPRWSRTARPSSSASARFRRRCCEFLKDKKDLGIHTEMFTDCHHRPDRVGRRHRRAARRSTAARSSPASAWARSGSTTTSTTTRSSRSTPPSTSTTRSSSASSTRWWPSTSRWRST